MNCTTILPMPKVISNTSPLQYLFQVGLLDLLPRLYGRVLVPPAVGEELARGQELGVDLPRIHELSWIEIVAPRTALLLPPVTGLGAGELHVITLARETADHLALLDDRRARRFADLSGVRYTGTLGVLLKAKQQTMLERLAPICDRLEERGFRFSPTARQVLLSMANE